MTSSTAIAGKTIGVIRIEWSRWYSGKLSRPTAAKSGYWTTCTIQPTPAMNQVAAAQMIRTATAPASRAGRMARSKAWGTNGALGRLLH